MGLDAAHEIFVESTLAAALQRLARVERTLNEMHAGHAMTSEDIARMQTSTLIAASHVRSAMQMMDMSPAADTEPAPALRVVR